MGLPEPILYNAAINEFSHPLFSYYGVNWIIGLCVLTLLGSIGWIVYLVNLVNKFKQEKIYAKNESLLSHKAWAAVQRKTGVIEFQMGLSSYAVANQTVKTLEDFNKFWDSKDQGTWQEFLAQMNRGPWEMKTVVLNNANCDRRIQIQSYTTQKNFNDVYFFIFTDVTANLNRLEVEIHKNAVASTVHDLHVKHFDALPFPAWQRDIHTNLVFCNQAYADACGMTSSAIIEENRCLWITETEAVDFPLYLKPLKKTITVSGDKRIYQFFEFKDSSSQSYYGYAIDLTENEIIQNGFKRHIAAYREVLNNISSGVTIYGPDRRLKYFNHAYARMYEMDETWLSSGPTLGEVLDHLKLHQLIPSHIDYATFKNKELQNVTTITAPYSEVMHLQDTRIIRKISAPHPLGGNFYLFEDVTAALTLEKQYNTQIAVQRATLDNLYEGIAVFDANHHLMFTNPAFIKLWQITQPDVLYKKPHVSELIDLAQDQFDEIPNWEKYRAKLIEHVTDGIPKKRRVIKKDGTVVDFSYMPMPDGSHLISYIDVTAKFKIENLLQAHIEAVGQIQMAQRNSTNYINSISNNFNNSSQSFSIDPETLAREFADKISAQQKLHNENIMAITKEILDTLDNSCTAINSVSLVDAA